MACESGLLDDTFLSDNLSQQRSALKIQDVGVLRACSEALNFHVFHATGSPRLERYLVQLWDTSPSHYIIAGKSTLPQHIVKNFGYSERFILALLKRDVEAAVCARLEQVDAAHRRQMTYFALQK